MLDTDTDLLELDFIPADCRQCIWGEEHIEQLPAEVKVGWEALTGYLYMEVSINGKSPITGWFVMGSPMKMDDMGYTHGLETSICQCS